MAFPTSRKKYYLEAKIVPEWTSTDNFLSDLRDHIELHSSQSLRDIFIAHSQRRGQFCVETKQIADKLLTLFATRNISCRGRKPNAQIQKIAQNKYQLNLSNLNLIINSSEFETWILALNCDASDIHLSPPKISAPSTSCVLSFNTIDAAITVKSKLQSQPFRDTMIHYTHWHVPRRVLSNNQTPTNSNVASPTASTTSKLGIVLSLVDNNSMSSSYSTPKSVTNSPCGALHGGPLYLRDPSIPPPPQRTAPNAPQLSIEVDTDADIDACEFDVDTFMKYCNIDEMTYQISMEESRLSHEANKEYVSSLHETVEKQQNIIRDLMNDNKYIEFQLAEQRNFALKMKDKYSALYDKYMALYHINQILCWSVKDTVDWMMRIQNGHFLKYKEYLMYNMESQNINGSMLSKLGNAELHRMGIVDTNDQNLMLSAINHLIHSKLRGK